HLLEGDDLERGRGGHAVADVERRVERLLDVVAGGVAQPAAGVADVRLQLAARAELDVAADVDALRADHAARLLHDEAFTEAGEGGHGAATAAQPSQQLRKRTVWHRLILGRPGVVAWGGCGRAKGKGAPPVGGAPSNL